MIWPRFYAHGVAAPSDLNRTHTDNDRRVA